MPTNLTLDALPRKCYRYHMADATLSREEVAAVRSLVEKLGLYAAAQRLQVHVQTLDVILAGRSPRRATVMMMRPRLAKVRA